LRCSKQTDKERKKADEEKEIRHTQEGRESERDTKRGTATVDEQQ